MLQVPPDLSLDSDTLPETEPLPGEVEPTLSIAFSLLGGGVVQTDGAIVSRMLTILGGASPLRLITTLPSADVHFEFRFVAELNKLFLFELDDSKDTFSN